MPTDPAPIKVEASGNFTGNDGSWSSVIIAVGNPPQSFEVLPATEIPETWVVSAAACNGGPSNCTELRGGTFNTSRSNTWAPKDLYQLGAERNLGLTTDSGQDADIGIYGFDKLGVRFAGTSNVSLDQQVIATINTSHFYLGNLGLSASRPIIFGDTSTSPGFLESLKTNNLVPSRSYGYTAGASYHKSNASLVLGGYDSSRFTPNEVIFDLAPTTARELVVGLRSVVLVDSNGDETSMLSAGHQTLVDSTATHIWLPEDACKSFEVAFDLTYDPIANLYLINDTVHDALLKRNASVVFQLSNSLVAGPAVNITLPYASFDLEVQNTYALVRDTSKYFPLRRARDESQFTLGRVFCQESFLNVNYEIGKFYVSQSIHAPDTASHIIATSSNNDSTNPPSSTNVPPVVKVTSHKSHSLPTPAIAGIAIAIVLVTLIVGGVLLFLNLKKRRARHGQPQVELSAAPARPRDMAELGDQGSGTTDEKEAEKMVDEDSPKDQRLIDEREIALMDHGNGQGSAHELSGPDVSRPELPSPDPNLKFELASETVARSELSTPEPGWPGRELPTPEPVLETAGAVAADASSSPFDHNLSPVSSPGSTWSRNRTGSRRRPTHLRMDSSESEGPWPNSEVPTRTRPSLRHSRVVSSESEGGWPPDRMSSTSSRRSHARVDSSDSESVQPRANIASVQHPHRRNLSSDSEPISPQQPSTSDYSTRPKHDRFNSTDSTDTFETRLLSPGSPYFPPLRQPVQAIPSIGPDTASSAAFPTSRSGLLSEEPSDMNEVPKAMSQDPKKRT